jgi:hypothetical protein
MALNERELMSTGWIYRFSNGVRKDLPLDDKGIPWEISRHDGKTVALFSDGTIAEFYVARSATEQQGWDELEVMNQVLTDELDGKAIYAPAFKPPDHPDTQTCACGDGKICHLHANMSHDPAPGQDKCSLAPSSSLLEEPVASQGLLAEQSGPAKSKKRRRKSNVGFFERALNTKLPDSTEPEVIGRYKTVEGQNPGDQHEPVFGVFGYKSTERNLLANYDRATVGSGLREYLWLYQTLRSMGRGWMAALREAIQVYFL